MNKETSKIRKFDSKDFLTKQMDGISEHLALEKWPQEKLDYLNKRSQGLLTCIEEFEGLERHIESLKERILELEKNTQEDKTFLKMLDNLPKYYEKEKTSDLTAELEQEYLKCLSIKQKDTFHLGYLYSILRDRDGDKQYDRLLLDISHTNNKLCSNVENIARIEKIIMKENVLNNYWDLKAHEFIFKTRIKSLIRALKNFTCVEGLETKTDNKILLTLIELDSEKLQKIEKRLEEVKKENKE